MQTTCACELALTSLPDFRQSSSYSNLSPSTSSTLQISKLSQDSRFSQTFRLYKRKNSFCLKFHWTKHRGFDSSNRKKWSLLTFASLNDSNGLSANSNAGSYSKSETDLEETRSKLNASLQASESVIDYTQALHEAARKFQLAIEQHGSLKKNSWFSKSWLGVDQVSWIKPFAYQAAVHALIKAVLEIASRGEGGDRDTHVFIQRSISRQLIPLQESIDEQLTSRKPSEDNWFWSQQHPLAVTSFVDLLESDPRFTAVTSVGWEGASVSPSTASDVSLMTLAINIAAAIVKLGSAKLSCPQFFSALTDEIGRLTNMLINYLPIDQVYDFMSTVGLRTQFLGYFGPRAARYQNSGEVGGEEGAFWVDLVQQLQRAAIVREHIRTKLTAYDSIEVLERDLAVFGFFAALGRKTKNFLAVDSDIDSDEKISGLLRYLIGGSILFYPQLASLNTYQLFVEVACEEMEWLPFYPTSSSSDNQLHAEKSSSINHESISLALNTCSRWISDFLKYSTWVQQPSGARAMAFLLKSQARLDECLQAYPSVNQQLTFNKKSSDAKLNAFSYGAKSKVGSKYIELSKRMTDQATDFDGVEKMEQLQLFDKELQDVDEALSRLECLLLEQEGPGKEQLTAACTNLETIRQLKKEVETLEETLRKKAKSVIQGKPKGRRGRSYANTDNETGRSGMQRTNNAYEKVDGASTYKGSLYHGDSNLMEGEGSEVSKDIENFELLRQELSDLERRIKESAKQNINEQDSTYEDDGDDVGVPGSSAVDHEVNATGDLVSQSLQKIKETTTDVWRGTQLLATDVAAALVLLKRSASGEELTERENKILKRTLTDLASVIPIGFLMLLPVTAVGHAAILAAIQRYVPSLIPSAYARERLDLIKQLEQIRELDIMDEWDETEVLDTSSNASQKQ